MEKKLGQEPAFPSKGSADCTTLSGYSSYQNIKFEGMSKRFYAACAAIQGLLSNSNPVVRSYTEEQLVQISYKHADELLKQESNG